MKHFLAVAVGLLLLLAPLWTLSGFVVVPEYRTGSVADYKAALIPGLTLYGGVFAGLLVGERLKARWTVSAFPRTFVGGIAGAMGAITLVVIVSFLVELVSTGRLMRPGETLALLPVLYIVGGILSAFMAAGAGLIAYGLGPSRR